MFSMRGLFSCKGSKKTDCWAWFVGLFFVFVEDNQCGDDTRHPTDAGQDEYDEHRAAATVDDRQRRKDDG